MGPPERSRRVRGAAPSRFPGGVSRLAALRRRSQPAWLLPPRALAAGRRAPETAIEGGPGTHVRAPRPRRGAMGPPERSRRVRGAAPSRFPGGASRLAALRRRSQPAWLLPPRALAAGRRAPETAIEGGPGTHVRAPRPRRGAMGPPERSRRVRGAAPSRFPGGASRLAALRRRSQPAWLLPPRALAAGRRAPETAIEGGPGTHVRAPRPRRGAMGPHERSRGVRGAAPSTY